MIRENKITIRFEILSFFFPLNKHKYCNKFMEYKIDLFHSSLAMLEKYLDHLLLLFINLFRLTFQLTLIKITKSSFLKKSQ